MVDNVPGCRGTAASVFYPPLEMAIVNDLLKKADPSPLETMAMMEEMTTKALFIDGQLPAVMTRNMLRVRREAVIVSTEKNRTRPENYLIADDCQGPRDVILGDIRPTSRNIPSGATAATSSRAEEIIPRSFPSALP